MNNNEFKYQKSLFSMYLNSWGVDKYQSENGQIKLVLTHATKGDSKISKTFDSEESYSIWMDAIVDDDDYYYNRARGLNCVLSALDSDF